MSKPRYTWRESALMIAMSWRSANHIATADFPAAVGPQITGRIEDPASLTAAKSSVELIPRKLNYRLPAVNVMSWQFALAQRDEKRAHFWRRHGIACLDGRLARDGRGEMLMFGRSSGWFVSGKSRERIAQAPLGIK